MYSQCPECFARFRVTAAALRAANGTVRCGRCGSAFNALAWLSDAMPPAVSRGGTAPIEVVETIGVDATDDGSAGIEAVEVDGGTGDSITVETIEVHADGNESITVEAIEVDAGGDDSVSVETIDAGAGVLDAVAADAPMDAEVEAGFDEIDQAFLETGGWSPTDISEAGPVDGPFDSPVVAPAAEVVAPILYEHESVPVEDITLEGERISIESPAELPVDFDLSDLEIDLDLDSTDEFEVLTDVPDSAYPLDEDDAPVPSTATDADAPVGEWIDEPAEKPAAPQVADAPSDDLLDELADAPLDEMADTSLNELLQALLETPTATPKAVEPPPAVSAATPPARPAESVVVPLRPATAPEARPVESVVVQLRPASTSTSTATAPARRAEPTFELSPDSPADELEDVSLEALLESPSIRPASDRRESPEPLRTGTLADFRWDRRRPAPEPVPAPAPAPSVSRGRRVAWALGCIALATTLAAQAVHHYRQDLARDSRFGPLVDAIYRQLGLPALPTVDVRAFELRQWGSVGLVDAGGRLTVRANLTNKAPYPQPHPILRLQFDDRYGEPVASRDFQPAEYLRNTGEATSPLAPGASAEVEMHVVEPDHESVGYQLDVCLPESKAVLRCARGPG